jgi:hypothetical protein
MDKQQTGQIPSIQTLRKIDNNPSPIVKRRSELDGYLDTEPQIFEVNE